MQTQASNKNRRTSGDLKSIAKPVPTPLPLPSVDKVEYLQAEQEYRKQPSNGDGAAEVNSKRLDYETEKTVQPAAHMDEEIEKIREEQAAIQIQRAFRSHLVWLLLPSEVEAVKCGVPDSFCCV